MGHKKKQGRKAKKDPQSLAPLRVLCDALAKRHWLRKTLLWLGAALMIGFFIALICKVLVGLWFGVHYLIFMGQGVSEGGLRALWADDFALSQRFELTEKGIGFAAYRKFDLAWGFFEISLLILLWLGLDLLDRRIDPAEE